MSCVHTMLLLPEKDLAKWRKAQKANNAAGYDFHWWTEALNKQVSKVDAYLVGVVVLGSFDVGMVVGYKVAPPLPTWLGMICK